MTAWRRLLVGLALAVALAAVGRADPLPLSAAALPLNPENLEQSAVGALVYRGGLHLRSSDPRFGGLSGLSVSPDGRRLVAVSDRGYWVTATLVYDEVGLLADAVAGEIGDLADPDGAPVADTPLNDAEELVRDGPDWLVTFERHHRIWRYPATPGGFAMRPQRVPDPPGLARAPPNGGLEALARLPDGRLFGLVEGRDGEGGRTPGWVGTPGRWLPLEYVRTGIFRPTGAAALPDGDVVVLERRFTLLGGPGARLARVPAAALRHGAAVEGTALAVLAPPLVVDNMEGIAARRGANGETILYLVSDDNYNVLQRTILLMFALAPQR
ncbi:MAG: esterase-like activity of phytase family protein [Rhodospirillaceae bacterium]